jgi:hypothetical protein
MISFTQLLQDKAGNKPAQGRERRVHNRLLLRSTMGELLCLGKTYPCQLIDISAGGCCLTTERNFSAGALAPVEIVATIRGQVVHMYGSTEWVRYEKRIGIRFTHPSLIIKLQLEGLISRLFEETYETPAQETAASAALAADGTAAGTQPGGADECGCDAGEKPPEERFSLAFLRQIHGGECRAMSWEDGEWPVDVRSLDGRLRLSGSFVDLSLNGCSVHTPGPYSGEFHLPVEVSFRLHGLPFLLAGVVLTVDDASTIGIRFTAMSSRRRDDLVQLIAELRASGKYQPNLLQDLDELPQEEDSLPPAADEPSPELEEEEIQEAQPERAKEETEIDGEDEDFWHDLKKGNWDL